MRCDLYLSSLPRFFIEKRDYTSKVQSRFRHWQRIFTAFAAL